MIFDDDQQKKVKIRNRPSKSFFRAKNFFKNFDSNIGVRMKLKIIEKTYTVDSPIQFSQELILRTMVFTETTRQREN